MPKTDELLMKLDTLKNDFFGTYVANVLTNRNFYDRDFAGKVLPDAAAQRQDLHIIIPPTATIAVDEAANHILTFPKVKVPVLPTDEIDIEEQEIAEKKRKFLNAWWRQVSQRYDVIGAARVPLLNEGRVVVRKVINWNLVPSKDDPKYSAKMKRLGSADFMWDVELLDNVTVFEDPSNYRDPQYVFVRYEILVEEAKRLYPDSKSTAEWRKHNDYDKVQYTEYWSAPTFDDAGSWEPGKYKQWIESESVKEGDNPYPYIPIAIESAGFGQEYRGIPIEKRYRGFTESVQDIFVAEARQMTSLEAVAEITAFAPVIRRNMAEEEALAVGPGAIWDLEGSENDPDRQAVEFARWPDIPVTVLQMLGKTTEIANSTLKFGILGGVSQPGVDTATEADQHIRNASAILSNPVRSLERLVAKINRWVLMDVETVLEHSVTVYGTSDNEGAEQSLSPKEIKGYYDTSVKLGTTDEDAISQNLARFWGEMALRLPFLSFFTAMERGDITDDPMGEMVKRSAEDVFLSPEFRQLRTLTGASSIGELAQSLQNTIQGGQAGPTGASSGGGGVNQNATLTDIGTGAAGPTDLVNDALARRDAQQAGSQLRG